MIIGEDVVEFDAAADVLIHFVARVGVATSQSVNNLFKKIFNKLQEDRKFRLSS